MIPKVICCATGRPIGGVYFFAYGAHFTATLLIPVGRQAGVMTRVPEVKFA
jgi:hypothetical protein